MLTWLKKKNDDDIVNTTNNNMKADPQNLVAWKNYIEPMGKSLGILA